MGKILLDITMSLDGFIAGPNVSAENPLGEGGERLHDWLFSAKTDADAAASERTGGTSGAVIVGGNTYHTAIDGPWGGVTPFEIPAFVLTKDIPGDGKEGFTFVSGGIESALQQAKAVAGDKNVWVMGGANTIQQFIKAELFDELHIHIAPVLFTKGTKLFENIGVEQIELKHAGVTQTPGATHVVYVPAK